MTQFDRISIAMSDGFPDVPSLNALRVFEVVARHWNFRVAAEELGVMMQADQGFKC